MLNTLWFAATLTQALLFIRYWQRGFLRQFPWASAMFALGVLNNVVLYAVRPRDSIRFALTWCAVQAALHVTKIVSTLEATAIANGDCQRDASKAGLAVGLPVGLVTLTVTVWVANPTPTSDPWMDFTQRLVIGIRASATIAAVVLFVTLWVCRGIARFHSRRLEYPLAQHTAILALVVLVEFVRQFWGWFDREQSNLVGLGLLTAICLLATFRTLRRR